MRTIFSGRDRDENKYKYAPPFDARLTISIQETNPVYR